MALLAATSCRGQPRVSSRQAVDITWNSRALLYHRLAVQRRNVAEARHLAVEVDHFCLQETYGTMEEVRIALRRDVRAGASHLAPAEGAAGGLAVFVGGGDGEG